MDNWQKNNKPSVCTRNPIEYLLPEKDKYELMRIIRQECIDEYGKDIVSECSKRKVCISKKCLGRELPWKSKTARPYLEKLAKTQKIENELLYIETDCNNCPIANKCSKVCNQVSDYINRDRTPEPQIIARECTEKLTAVPINNRNFNQFTTNIPWDALTERRRNVIRLHLYDRRDFKYIAHKLELNNQARAKYEYYAALTTVAEYAIMREFLNNNMKKLTNKQQKVMELVYYNNNKLCEVAKYLKVSKQAIQQMITRVINKYNIKWPKFVWKSNNKVVYNVPRILK